MTRKELLRSREYWIAQIQLQLFDLIEDYQKKHNLNKTQLAEKLGVTKSYITQILNGNFDHKISKLIDLSLAFGKVPILKYEDIEKHLEDKKYNLATRAEKQRPMVGMKPGKTG